MIEFGRALMVQQVLTNASREGARVAILDGSLNTSGAQQATASSVTSTVTGYLQNAGLPTANATVQILDKNGATVEPTTVANGDPIQVVVQIPYSSVSWLPAPRFLTGNATLSATTVMRRETIQTSGS
jgi:Flp pilus assembly protein TadG